MDFYCFQPQQKQMSDWNKIPPMRIMQKPKNIPHMSRFPFILFVYITTSIKWIRCCSFQWTYNTQTQNAEDEEQKKPLVVVFGFFCCSFATDHFVLWLKENFNQFNSNNKFIFIFEQSKFVWIALGFFCGRWKKPRIKQVIIHTYLIGAHLTVANLS